MASNTHREPPFPSSAGQKESLQQQDIELPPSQRQAAEQFDTYKAGLPDPPTRRLLIDARTRNILLMIIGAIVFVFVLLGIAIVYRLSNPDIPKGKTVAVSQGRRITERFEGTDVAFLVLSADQVRDIPSERLSNGALKPVEFTAPTKISGDIAGISFRGHQPIIIDGSAKDVDINIVRADIVITGSVLAGHTASEILTEGMVMIGGNIGAGVSISAGAIRYTGTIDPGASLIQLRIPGQPHTGGIQHVPLNYHSKR